MEGEPPLQQVVSLNAKARAFGIVPGMTQVEVDTFTAITVLRRSIREETATTAILLECAGAFSPRVEKQSEDRTFFCVVDIAGTENLFGPSEVLVSNLLTRVTTAVARELLGFIWAIGARAETTVRQRLAA